MIVGIVVVVTVVNVVVDVVVFFVILVVSAPSSDLWMSSATLASHASRHGQHNGLNDLLIYTHIDRNHMNEVFVPFLRNLYAIALFQFGIAFFLINCSQ